MWQDVRALVPALRPLLFPPLIGVVAVYRDGDKIGARPGDEGDTIMARRQGAVGYWDGETEA